MILLASLLSLAYLLLRLFLVLQGIFHYVGAFLPVVVGFLH